ncbi:tripartite tricarboxylate transporter TctB family protein [Kytococcus sedentarius]|uniref:tripartite tricarboxylate transporter TctB family protein n=1 Tax=Kytococcus sedentarius TaxID=1276 RepID=UPI00387A7A92
MSAQASEKLDRASPSPIESHPVTAHQARRREVLVGLTVLVAGLLLLVAALQIAEPARQSPGFGPRVLPLAVSSGLVICGALLVWGALRGRDPRAGLGDDLLGEEDGDRVEEVLDWDEPPVPWTGLAVVVGSLVLYAVLFIPLGFIASTLIFLMALTTWIHPGAWLRNLIFAVVVPIGVYFLFTEVLAVKLPSGILPF